MLVPDRKTEIIWLETVFVFAMTNVKKRTTEILFLQHAAEREVQLRGVRSKLQLYRLYADFSQCTYILIAAYQIVSTICVMCIRPDTLEYLWTICSFLWLPIVWDGLGGRSDTSTQQTANQILISTIPNSINRATFERQLIYSIEHKICKYTIFVCAVPQTIRHTILAWTQYFPFFTTKL